LPNSINFKIFKMKTKVSLFFLFILISSFVFSQKNEPFDFDKFKAKKIAYLTDALNLTPDEAQKFWPVYNEFEKKRFVLISEKKQIEKKLMERIDDMPDDKYVELSRKLVSFLKLESDLLTEYNERFLKVLPPKKVVQLFIAELDFKGQLLRDYKKGERDRK
jgi:hypothetical protein